MAGTLINKAVQMFDSAKTVDDVRDVVIWCRQQDMLHRSSADNKRLQAAYRSARGRLS